MQLDVYPGAYAIRSEQPRSWSHSGGGRAADAGRLRISDHWGVRYRRLYRTMPELHDLTSVL